MSSHNESYPDQAISCRKFGGNQDNVKIKTPICFINLFLSFFLANLFFIISRSFQIVVNCKKFLVMRTWNDLKRFNSHSETIECHINKQDDNMSRILNMDLNKTSSSPQNFIVNHNQHQGKILIMWLLNFLRWFQVIRCFSNYREQFLVMLSDHKSSEQ